MVYFKKSVVTALLLSLPIAVASLVGKSHRDGQVNTSVVPVAGSVSVNNLGTNADTSCFQVKACCCCDKLLMWKNTTQVTVKQLKKKKWTKRTPGMRTEMLDYYTYRGEGCAQDNSLSSLVLSPRSYWSPDRVEKRQKEEPCFDICKDCNEGKKIPLKAIANGSFAFCEPPKVLTELNDVELALVSQGRIDRHVFNFYAGAHKCVKTWHQLFFSNVEHTMSVMNRLHQVKAPKEILCTLSGPFTCKQKMLVMNRMQVDRNKVVAAFAWLQLHNRTYSHFKVPDPDEIMDNIIIVDHSDMVPSEDTRVESIYETTILFPQVNDIGTQNGGFENQASFLESLLKDRASSKEVLMLGQTTSESVRAFEGDNLVRCFPLQFPYGIGGRPPKMDLLQYLQHLVQISIPWFQTPNFLLVVHNLAAKAVAVRQASIKCKYRVTEKEVVSELIAGIGPDDIQKHLDDLKAGERWCGNVGTRRLLSSVRAVSNNLGFTDEAAKEERKKMFSVCTRQGLPAVFFTVTVDDQDNFRMYVYANQSNAQEPPTAVEDLDKIADFLQECESIRIKFPGFSEYDFENVMDIVISEIIGWDESIQGSKRDGGAFGRCSAWYATVEEQARKTLHTHFLLWIEDWKEMLDKLYSRCERVQEEGRTELVLYVDHVLSTSIFSKDKLGLSRRSSCHRRPVESDARVHSCQVNEKSEGDLHPCTTQQLRNMRYKHCSREASAQAIMTCKLCSVPFCSEDLSENVMAQRTELAVGTNESDRKVIQRLVRLRGNAQLTNSELSKNTESFLVQWDQNMHRQSHSSTCWKKGCSCRMCLPRKPCENTTLHFFDEDTIDWYDWSGQNSSRAPFVVEPKRHAMDVFANSYHPLTSCVFCCNSNVQTGIDGGHIMYCTCYAAKSTKREDKESIIQALNGLKYRIATEQRLRQAQMDPFESDEEGNSGANADGDSTLVGFRRMLASLMNGTKGYVISAPMAKYLVLNGSRFRSSHQFESVPLWQLLKEEEAAATVRFQNGKSFLTSKRDNYLYRPAALESFNVYDYFARFTCVSKTKKLQGAEGYMEFSSANHMASGKYLVTARTRSDGQVCEAIPVVYHDMLEDTKKFGCDILSDTPTPAANHNFVETHCQAVLALFVPHRQLSDLKVDDSWRQGLREAWRNKTLKPEHVSYLNNIQDSRNSLNAGRIEGVLERCTQPLENPNGETSEEKAEMRQAVKDHIDAELTELLIALGIPEEDTDFREDAEPEKMTLQQLREEGTWGCGTECGIPGNPMNPDNIMVEEVDEDTVTDKKRALDTPSFRRPVRVIDLLKLKVRTIDRQVNMGESDAKESFLAKGTAGSIRKWAQISFNGDKMQEQAFESIMADFVLGFLEDAQATDPSLGNASSNPLYSAIDVSNPRHEIQKWRRELLRLRGMPTLKDKERLVMFMTGPGGSGKSMVIDNVLAYASKFCNGIGTPFTKRTIVVTALTGVAATSIRGETIHAACGIKVSGGIWQSSLQRYQQEWAETRMVIVDEISFAKRIIVENLHDACCEWKGKPTSRYGNLSVVFCGDFSQLEPVGGVPLFMDVTNHQWLDWTNCFIELDGDWRFRNDKRYGALMKRLRDGECTKEDFDLLDSRLIGPNGTIESVADLPGGTQIACPKNRDRVAMNNAAFFRHLTQTHSMDESVSSPGHTIMIKASNMTWRHSKLGFSAAAKTRLFDCVGDYECLASSQSETTTKKSEDQLGKRFVDPILKLHESIPLMINKNEDVSAGKANGTICELKKVKLKKGGAAHMERVCVDGYWVNCIESKFVDHLVVTSTGHSNREEMKLFADINSCRVNMPFQLIPEAAPTKSWAGARMHQFAVVVNYATTVHKLQGRTIQQLYVSNWQYTRNWVYVALSRVTTLEGLFLRSPVNRFKNYRPHGNLISMLNHFRNKKPERASSDDFLAE